MGDKKKIGILTLHRSFNYGAVWQCWALKRACEQLGCEVEIIDFNPFGRYTIKNMLRHSPYVAYRYIAHMHLFSRFLKNRLNLTTYSESNEWIQKNPPLDDIYIVGSDMVWSNSLVDEYLDSYLLNFAPLGVKRISYAASTGGKCLELKDYQLAELRKFSAISVREKQSVQDVQQKVIIPVVDVCDPTILLSKETYALEEEKPLCLPKRYVAYFNLAGDRVCEESAKLLGEKLGVPIVNIGGKYQSWARNYPAPTPEQWLYIIHHADYVCGTSFHVVAFAILFQSPFVYCAPEVKGHSTNVGRIMNMLEQTHFMHRYIANAAQITNELLDENRDLINNISYVEAYRNRSFDWLKNALESETN